MNTEQQNYDALILTEGKTDWIHLKKAFESLNVNYNIQFDSIYEDRGDNKLLDSCQKLSALPNPQSLPTIFIFDRDTKEMNKVIIKDKKFKNWGKNIFSFVLPKPDHRKDYTNISIELFYRDSEIMTKDINGRRLFLSSEFNEKGKFLENANIHYGNYNKLKGITEQQHSKVIDTDVFNENGINIALTKTNFADNIFNEVHNFDNFDFNQFNKIYKIVELIINSSNKSKSGFKKTNEDSSIKPIHTPVIKAKYRDHPPNVSIFIGREEYLSKLETQGIRVIAITGLGGEGKSTLAARYYYQFLNQTSIKKYTKFGWYDCRELETPFHEKLSFLLEMLSDGKQSKGKYSDENIDDTISRFIDFLNMNDCLIVFDNVDGFVNKETSTLTGHLKKLFDGLLNSLNKSLIIFTSRAPLEHHHFSFLEIPLIGFSLQESKDLAQKFGVLNKVADERILKFIHEHTKGHALWLNLIFAQIRSGRFDNTKIDEIFSKPSDALDVNLLQSIWDTLSEFEKEIIWTISVFNRPPDIIKIEKSINKSYQKCIKAINNLVKLRLIIEIDVNDEKHFDLHPIILMKAKHECKPQKQARLLKKVISVLSLGNWKIIMKITNSNEFYSSDLERYVECAEIAVNNGNALNAINFLNDLIGPLRKYGEDLKFVQLCNDLFSQINYNEINFSNNEKLSEIFSNMFTLY